ncbi:MAG TPA: pitrilysin family protein, partial [Pyrinomonadaceae bacterium]|nr:pitrilysin family protein [Pyrinomonadaceae bacterium]
MNRFTVRTAFAFLLLPFAFSFASSQTEQPPEPSAPKSVTVPAVKETKLRNGLTVAVIERKSSPLVTVYLLVKIGASSEDESKAGLANLTADMLTKGTKTRTATQIAEEIEFLGGSISSGAGWNNSFVSITVTPDKLDKAMAILADVVLNPAFKQEELELLKTQALDGLTYNLKQPGFLANYVASKYSFNEHPAGGTPDTLKGIVRADIVGFHSANFKSYDSSILFAGDVTPTAASGIAIKYFGRWGRAIVPRKEVVEDLLEAPATPRTRSVLKRLAVIDLPNSGQAAVTYARRLREGRTDFNEATNRPIFFEASVLNSLLGGGYSSRLNQEIRIKRGLSYGAGSSFAWRA